MRKKKNAEPTPKPSISNEVEKVEKYMIEKAANISSFNELYNFYFSYSSVFLPTLEFSVNHLNEDSICRLANFGILIDHLSQNQIKLFIKLNIDFTSREISQRTGQSESTILAMLDDLSIAQKTQLTTTFITFGSISRDATLLDAAGLFSVQNQTILWANIFSHFFSFPILTDLYLNKTMIDEADKALRKVKELISNKNRSYDAIFAIKYSGLNDLSEKNITKIPKYFIGTKYNWLLAYEGLYFCKYLLTKDKLFAKKAIDYNNKIQAFLMNPRVSKSEWSYRNFDSQGPSPNLSKTIKSLVKGPIRIFPISTIEWLIISDNQCFIIDIPSNFSFYFSPEMTVTYKDENGQTFETNAIEDVGTIIDFGKNPADFVLRHLSQLATPESSNALYNSKYRRMIIDRYLSSEETIIAHLEAAYNKTIASPILDLVKKGSKTSFESLIAYGLLISFENIAQASGIKIDSETWMQIRTIVSSILVSRLAIVFENQTKKEKQQKIKAKSDAKLKILTSEEKIQELYSKISESEKEIEAAVSEMKDDGLMDIMNLSNKLKEIILSGMSPEEIKVELETYLNI